MGAILHYLGPPPLQVIVIVKIFGMHSGARFPPSRVLVLVVVILSTRTGLVLVPVLRRQLLQLLSTASTATAAAT